MSEYRGIGLRSERGPILGSVMVSTAIVAIDATIIATAVPSIVNDLGGFSLFPWLFSIYLLAQAVTTPIMGRLSDQFGRKPIMLFGVGLFVFGSLAAALSPTMLFLIVFRGVQGVGAGCIMPMTMTIIGDIYTVQERARIQGYVASMWASGAIAGPLIGGLFVAFLNWRWIFWINLPIGLFAAWLMIRHFAEKKMVREQRKVDYLGAALMAVGFSLLILGLLQGGVAWDWLSAPSLLVFGFALVALIAFFISQRYVADPMLPTWIYKSRVLNAGNLIGFCVGAMTVGFSSFVPTYSEGVLGVGVLVGGFTIGALLIGWPIAASTSGRLYLRIGFRNTSVIGAFFAILGTFLTLWFSVDTPQWFVIVACLVVGLGLGYIANPSLVAVQSSVSWAQRGVVTGTTLFTRSLGNALGAAVFGAIANSVLLSHYRNVPASLAAEVPADVESTVQVLGTHVMSDSATTFIRAALDDAVNAVFLSMFVAALIALAILIFLMPRKLPMIRVGDEKDAAV